ncbi:MAG TPA: tetratricopeptide repeat protein [Acidiphilium sp.]|uniref:tetratricopeptide repeat protein n=1 Tax=unclassified Acidiphilium TaxID=2617493 RepID=UPI000BD24B3D|nr:MULTISPECIES: tetratricopeptide repeat protein [unclassified Acidiphilium]OYV57110.1 MAG: co-chaperone YbbN [Acidiphilium sp. 20-67-58]HQT60723.1 tetratricopeptide repeat protein [Acidiphilium sp.]HQU10203.1 tetratricopeptide repeat protein [Acidiphilium sp.]
MDHLTDSDAQRPIGADAQIIEGSQASFMADVVEASRKVPVLVDFWATWCGPCKTLTPTLEKVVRAYGGRIRLVKIDIDENRALVQQLASLGLPLQSVPTVAAFWQGQIADLFQGALPESEVRRFVDALLKLAGSSAPSADLIAQARAAMEQNRAEEAAALFGAALDEDENRPEAWAGLVRALIALGADDRAAAILAEIPPALADHAEIAAAKTALSVAQEGRAAARQLAELQQKLASNENDHAARLALAVALNATGNRTEAAEALLDIMRRQRGWNDDAARLQLLKFFDAWGVDDADTMAARRKLSALLFS